jgi:prolyl oligopeptidase
MTKKSLRSVQPKSRSFDWDEVAKAGYMAYSKGDCATSRSLFAKSFKQIERFGRYDVRLGYTCMMLGFCDFSTGRHAEAQPHLRRAVRIYEHLGDQQKVAEILRWLAMTHVQRRHFQRAAGTFLQAADVAKTHLPEDKDRYCMLVTYAAESYWRIGRHDDALQLFRHTLRVASAARVPASVAHNLAEKLIAIISGKQAAQSELFDDLLKLARRASRLAWRRAVRIEPPPTKRGRHRESHFARQVSDPYRWLEDIQAQEVTDWVELQAKHADTFLNVINGQQQLLERLRALYEVELPDMHRKVAEYYFHEHYGARAAAKQIFRRSAKGKKAALVFDANKLPKDALLYNYSISPNGEMMLYAVAPNGSDWHWVKVRDFRTGKDLPDELPELRSSSIVWKQDSSGFFYSAFTRKQTKQRVYFHKLGTPAERDVVVYEHSDPDVLIGISITLRGKFLIIYTTRSDRRRYSVSLKAVRGRSRPPIVLFAEQPSQHRCIGQSKDTLFFSTDKGAPLHRIVSMRIDMKNHRAEKVRAEVAQKPDLLKRAYFWGGQFFMNYATADGETLECRKRGDRTPVSRVKLPDNAAVESCSFVGWPKMEMKLQGPTTPKSIYEFDFKTGELRLDVSQKTLINVDEYTTEKLYATSKDGARVPFYVSYKKGLPLNGDNPTILTGYGGFNHSVAPRFCYYNLAWMEQGGICVEAVLRGDGDLGRHWRDQGTRGRKQNTFNDFIAVARELIKKRFTRPARLGITGSSNGGLLVAAAMTQRPELFGAVAVHNGLLDMLRYHKFDFAHQYISEYGTADKEADCRTLYAYSPLHRLKRRAYPPVLINVATNDDRVNPAHSYKFAAALQHLQTGDAPVLLSVETNAGHCGKQKSMRAMRELAFFGAVLGLMPDCYLRRAAADARARSVVSVRAARQASS